MSHWVGIEANTEPVVTLKGLLWFTNSILISCTEAGRRHFLNYNLTIEHMYVEPTLSNILKGT